ncbi:MAG: hypothetical protein GY754_07410 [bacterium]|nr:hypothetical protein [bacterium]
MNPNKTKIISSVMAIALSFVFTSCDNSRDERFGAKTFQPQSGGAIGNTVRKTPDGGTILGGNKGTGIWLSKLDSSNAVQWEKTYESAQEKSFSGSGKILVLDEGGYLFVTASLCCGETTYNPRVLKINNDGSAAWEKSYFSGGPVRAIDRSMDGGFVMAGNLGMDAWVIKIDSAGEILWQKSYDFKEINSIKAVPSGGYVVSGSEIKSGYLDDISIVMIIDENGAVVSGREFGIDGDRFETASVGVASDGSYFVSGMYAERTDETPDPDDCWVMKLNSSLDIVWSKAYDYNTETDSVTYMDTTNDGGAVLTGVGWSGVPFSTNIDMLAYKIDSNGNVNWEKTYHFGRGLEVGYEIHQTSIGYIMSGAFSGKALLLNVDNNGEMPGSSLRVSNGNGKVRSLSLYTKELALEGVDTGAYVVENSTQVSDSTSTIESF